MAPAASVSNRVLIAVIAVTVLFFATYYLILPTMRPFAVPGRTAEQCKRALRALCFYFGARLGNYSGSNNVDAQKQNFQYRILGERTCNLWSGSSAGAVGCGRFGKSRCA